jgi:acyl carrier protein
MCTEGRSVRDTSPSTGALVPVHQISVERTVVGAEKARAVIVEFLERTDKSRDDLSVDTPLYGEGLELDSLEAAELSVMLEDALGTDPFSSAAELPETVGDILAFYEVPSKA